MTAASTAVRIIARRLQFIAYRLGSALVEGRQEARNRHALKFMSERTLRDIGLSRVEIATRSAKLHPITREN